jgi:hypothetical protein
MPKCPFRWRETSYPGTRTFLRLIPASTHAYSHIIPVGGRAAVAEV